MTSSWIDEKPRTSKDSVGKYEEKRALSETYSWSLCKDGTEQKFGCGFWTGLNWLVIGSEGGLL